MYQAGQEIVKLDPAQLQLRREAGVTEGLCLDIAGSKADASYPDISVHFMFPLSSPGQLVTFCDRNGKEIGVITNAQQLDRLSREILQQELERAYFVPKITRILKIKEEFGLVHWEVETDKGPRRFQVQSRYDIRAMGGGRHVVRDIDGNRYDIPEVDALDAQSRNLLELEI